MQQPRSHDYYMPEATARVIEACLSKLAQADDACELRVVKKRIGGCWSFDVQLLKPGKGE